MFKEHSLISDFNKYQNILDLVMDKSFLQSKYSDSLGLNSWEDQCQENQLL